jgi:hypothetical protein
MEIFGINEDFKKYPITFKFIKIHYINNQLSKSKPISL